MCSHVLFVTAVLWSYTLHVSDSLIVIQFNIQRFMITAAICLLAT